MNVRGGYPGTGYSVDIWPVLGRKRMVLKGHNYVQEHKELGQENVLTIHLVAEEKYQKRNDKTPKRKKLSAAYNCYDSDEDGAVLFDTMNSLNRRNGVYLGGVIIVIIIFIVVTPSRLL